MKKYSTLENILFIVLGIILVRCSPIVDNESIRNLMFMIGIVNICFHSYMFFKSLFKSIKKYVSFKK